MTDQRFATIAWVCIWIGLAMFWGAIVALILSLGL